MGARRRARFLALLPTAVTAVAEGGGLSWLLTEVTNAANAVASAAVGAESIVANGVTATGAGVGITEASSGATATATVPGVSATSTETLLSEPPITGAWAQVVVVLKNIVCVRLTDFEVSAVEGAVLEAIAGAAHSSFDEVMNLDMQPRKVTITQLIPPLEELLAFASGSPCPSVDAVMHAMTLGIGVVDVSGNLSLAELGPVHVQSFEENLVKAIDARLGHSPARANNTHIEAACVAIAYKAKPIPLPFVPPLFSPFEIIIMSSGVFCVFWTVFIMWCCGMFEDPEAKLKVRKAKTAGGFVKLPRSDDCIVVVR